MRPELNEIEYIEQYLLNELNADQKLEFEKELLKNTDFKKKVELQKSLVEGVKNASLRKSIARSFSKAKLKKKLKWGALGILVISAVVAGSKLSNDSKLDKEIESKIPIEEMSKVIPDGESLKTQYFSIQADRDTFISTADGLVLGIEAGTFIDEGGSVVTGEIQISIKEAFQVEDILSSGLSTVTTKDEPLETAGMFKLTANQNGEDLIIAGNKPIIAEIPTDELKPGMQLYNGETDSLGNMKWGTPKELEQFLLPVDMSLLDFYPDRYEKALKKMKSSSFNSAYSDSVYSSFGAHFTEKGRNQFLRATDCNEGNSVEDEELVSSLMKINQPTNVINSPSSPNQSSLASSNWPTDSAVIESSPCPKNFKYRLKIGLNPAQLKAVWNKKLNGSLIATKEFEKRIQLIHKSGNEKILSLYVKNIDQKISKIDEMASRLCSGKLRKGFKDLANLNQGRVLTNPKMVKKYNEFFVKRQKKNQKEMEKVESYWTKEQERDKDFSKIENKQNSKETNRFAENRLKEDMDNLASIYKQLNINRPEPSFVGSLAYRFTIARGGWFNCDSRIGLVNLTAVSRRSSGVRQDDKVATIIYSDFRLKVEGEFDRIYPYIITKDLPSFQRLQVLYQDSSKYGKSLNNNYKYSLGIIAYKGDQAYTWFEETLWKEKMMYRTPQKGGEKEFYQKIKAYSKTDVAKDVKSDLKYQKKLMSYQGAKNKEREMIRFREDIQEYVFPNDSLDERNYLRSEVVSEGAPGLGSTVFKVK